MVPTLIKKNQRGYRCLYSRTHIRIVSSILKSSPIIILLTADFQYPVKTKGLHRFLYYFSVYVSLSKNSFLCAAESRPRGVSSLADAKVGKIQIPTKYLSTFFAKKIRLFAILPSFIIPHLNIIINQASFIRSLKNASRSSSKSFIRIGSKMMVSPSTT